MEQKSLAIDCQRIKHFLELNQLVQASGLVTRVESMLQDKITAESSPGGMEKHSLWQAFRSSFRVKSKILSGATSDALTEAEILLSEITKEK